MATFNENSSDSPLSEQELDWQAFQYVSGEMSAGKAAAFEELLGVDQAAREAVARSVELLAQMSTIAVTEPLRMVDVTRPSRRRAVFGAIVAVAALIAVCLSFGAFEGHDTDESGRRVVSLWTEPRDPGLLSDEPEDELAAMDDEDADDLAIPGWLLAALEAPSDDAPEEN